MLIKPFRNSISLRLAALFCVCFTLFLSAAFLLAFLEVYYSLEKGSREVIKSKWSEISVVFADEGIKGVKNFLDSEDHMIQNAPFMIRILNKQGQPLFLKASIQKEHFDLSKILSNEIPLGEEKWVHLEASDDEDKYDIYTNLTKTGEHLQIGRSSEGRYEILENLATVFIFVGMAFTFLSGLLGYWYAKRVLRPVRDLTQTIKAIEAGDFKQRASLSNVDDELQVLGSVFNRALERIDQLISGMRNSVDNVAHDILTPLSRIRGVAERAILRNATDENIIALQECAEATVEISDLVSQILEISKAEAGTMILRRSEVDIQVLINSVIDAYEFVAAEKSIQIQCEVQSGLSWSFDASRMRQVLGNLLDNALKFSPSKSVIQIQSYIEDRNLKIKIKDQGFGISSDDLPHIFERLYRGDKSRATEGSGLGLAVAKSIVKAHQGQIFVTSFPDLGSEFTLSFKPG